MKFSYCPDCGSPLSSRNLGDEVGVPWCDKCAKPWFPIFPVATISLVYNDGGEVLLLRQSYISTEFCNLVSGYMQPGESAEECARREILEETGIAVDRLEIMMTHWFAKKEMMMIGFIAHADDRTGKEGLRLSSEVDDAFWCPAGEILGYLSTRPGATSRILAERFLATR